MKIPVIVDIDFDEMEPEFCGDSCKYLQLVDYNNELGDDFCWLFGESLVCDNDFSLRCKERLDATR